MLFWSDHFRENSKLQMDVNTDGNTSRSMVTSGQCVYAIRPRSRVLMASSSFQCLSEEGYIVAHYDLRPPNIAVYGVSGNTFTVHEAYSSLCVGELGLFGVLKFNLT